MNVPVLAKEFVVDERQLPLLRSAGADLVLLLASILPGKKLARFVDLARELGLEPLVEAHDEREVEAALSTDARLIGLNNRNLRTLKVDPESCLRLRTLVPNDRLVVGESGVGEARTLVAWRALGFDAALIGETLMRAADPASAARAFVSAGSVPHDVAAEARRPLVKICGVTDQDGALAALRSGADAIGLNLVPGTPRALTLAEATWLATLVRQAAPAGTRPQIVAVFADAPQADIDAAIAAFAPDAVQLSGHEPVSAIAAVARPVWKVLHLPAADAAGAPSGPDSIAEITATALEAGREFLAAGTARLILDTAGGPFPGGTGTPVAREIAAAVAREIPVILAGGLDAGNVAQAVLEVPAVGVDVASGVELRPARASATAAAATARGHCRRRFSAAQGPASDRALREACPRRPLRPAARPRRAPRPFRSRSSSRTTHGKWGLNRDFGGRYVPETLIAALEQLEAAWAADPPRSALLGRAARAAVPLRRPAHADLSRRSARRRDPGGGARAAAGPPAANLPDRIRLYLKREDLNHTGAHKLNNALGQVLLTRRLGKDRVIAETGAGMHGVATATACALLEDPVRRPHGRRGHRPTGPQRSAHGGARGRGPAGPRRLGHAQGRGERGACATGSRTSRPRTTAWAPRWARTRTRRSCATSSASSATRLPRSS